MVVCLPHHADAHPKGVHVAGWPDTPVLDLLRRGVAESALLGAVGEVGVISSAESADAHVRNLCTPSANKAGQGARQAPHAASSYGCVRPPCTQGLLHPVEGCMHWLTSKWGKPM